MDFVHCNRCFHRPGQLPKREFILTSCGHIFCRCCERSNQIEHCQVCNQSCSTTPLSSQMVEQVRVYFEDADVALAKTLKVIEFQKGHRLKLFQYLASVWDKYQKSKFTIQKLQEENVKLKKELDMYRRGKHLMTPLPPSPTSPIFCNNSQESQFLRMQSQSSRTPNSPFFITPRQSQQSRQSYRTQNTPSTPMSDNSDSPGSECSQQSYRSAATTRSNSQQKVYRPGLTPPLGRLSLLSVSERPRQSSSRY